MQRPDFKLFLTPRFIFKTVFGLLFWTIGLIVLIRLGLWQLERLEWKQGILGIIEQERLTDPALTPFDAELLTTMIPARLSLRRGHVTGWLSGAPIAIGPRPKDGVAGYHIYAPVTLSAPSGVQDTADKPTALTLLTNFGWIAADKRDAFQAAVTPLISTAPAPETDTGTNLTIPLSITGYLVEPEAKGRFSANNFPDQNIWMRADFGDIARHFNINEGNSVELFFYADQIPAAFASLAVPEALPESLPAPRAYGDFGLKNDHLYYARFWFVMAFFWTLIPILAVISGLRKK